MADFIKAQATFTATLWDSGKVTIGMSYTYRENYLAKPTYAHEYRALDGTCEPNDLPYTLWAEMESEI